MPENAPCDGLLTFVVVLITREGQTFTGKTFSTPAYLNTKAQLLLFSLIFKKEKNSTYT